MTSQEIAVRQGDTMVQQTARDLEAAYRIAEALGRTSFVPQHFRGKTEDAMAAILYGQTIGMDAMTALQNLYVIGGKPALYARPMVGIVLAQGHEIWTEEMSDAKVVVCGRRKGSDHVERSEWTIDRARLAGYTSNKKYMSDPQSMLYARASGDVARRVAPDALLGMAYNIEELEASAELDNASNVTPLPQRSRARQVEAAPAPEREPVDIDALTVQVENSESLDELRNIWKIVADLDDSVAGELRDKIMAQQVEIKNRAAIAEAEVEPSHEAAVEAVTETLDAEIVEAS